MDPCTIEISPFAFFGIIQVVHRRLIHYGSNRLIIFIQPDGDTPVGQIMHKGCRAINGVDDKTIFVGGAGFSGFLAEDTIAGIFFPDAGTDKIFHRPVSIRDQIAGVGFCVDPFFLQIQLRSVLIISLEPSAKVTHPASIKPP